MCVYSVHVRTYIHVLHVHVLYIYLTWLVLAHVRQCLITLAVTLKIHIGFVDGSFHASSLSLHMS